MKELSNHIDITTTNVDKEGAVVTMDVKNYIKEALGQLNNKDCYKILNKGPRTSSAKLLNYTIQRFKKEKKLLEEKIPDDLKVSNPKSPKIYVQPKIHKENNHGQSVVSSVNCHFSTSSK